MPFVVACPTCGKDLTYIAQYGRWYCYAESKYAPKDIQPIAAAKPREVAPASAEPTSTEIAPSVVMPEPTAYAPTPSVPTPANEPPKTEPEPQPTPTADSRSPPTERGEPAPVASPAVESVVSADSTQPAKPELKRDAVTKAKKSKLIEWCKAYGIDAMGSRTVLRDRLLEYMDAHKIDETEEEASEEVEQALPEATPSAAAEASLPVADTTSPEPTAAEPAAEPVPTIVPTPEPAPEAAKPEPEELPPIEEAKPEPTASAAPPPAIVERVEPAPPVETPKEAPAPAPRPSPPPAVEIAKALPCPMCGKDLTYIAKYDRLYCYAEGKYAPKDYGKEPPAIETEKAGMDWRRAWRKDQAEMRESGPPLPPIIVEVPKAEAKVANPCPTCGRSLRYVKDYDRWWCDAEKKYAPKDYGRTNACPTCGKELTWIPEYLRWYCYSEFKYAPKTIPAPPAGVAAAVERPIPAIRAQPAVARPEPAAMVSGIARAEHLHGRPGTGIALAAAGFALLILQNLIVGVLPALGIVVYDSTTPDGLMITRILIFLGFLGLVLALAGVVVGLRSVRSR